MFFYTNRKVWHIIPQIVGISSSGTLVYHHAKGVDKNSCGLMIYNFCEIGDMRGFAVIKKSKTRKKTVRFLLQPLLSWYVKLKFS